jgi:hypothetical protein
MLSLLRCPECGHEEEEVIPVNACQFLYVVPKVSECVAAKAGRLLWLLVVRIGWLHAVPRLITRWYAKYICANEPVNRT